MTSEHHSQRPRQVRNSRDIARLLNVSQATVSRVLNGRPGVRPATRKRVLAAIEDLGYVPNAGARGLITGRSGLIGLLVSNITNSFYAEIVQEISRRALAEHYNLMLCNTEERADRQGAYLELLVEQRVEGVIMTSALEGVEEMLGLLARRKVPIVLVNRILDQLDHIDMVSIDNVGGGKKATQHLLGLGHERIVYLGGREDALTNRDRLRGYSTAIQERFGAVDSAYIAAGEYTRENGYRAIRGFIEAGIEFSGAVCADDTIALGALDALEDLGRGVPGDVAVIGFDDIPLASMRAVSLSSIRQPFDALAKTAIDLLVNRIMDPDAEPRQVIFPAEIVHRRSCGCPLGKSDQGGDGRQPSGRDRQLNLH